VAERALTVTFLGNTAGLEAALKRTSAQLNGIQLAGARMQSVGRSLTHNLTVPIVGLGLASADLAVKFSRSMELLHTQAGVSQKAVAQLSKGVLNMAGSVGTSPQQLAEAMYRVASALNATTAPAHRISTEMGVLRIAAEGAKVGGADLTDVTSALDAAVVSGIKGVSNYSSAMGALNATVGGGEMTMQDLADALSTGLLAPMRTYGLSIEDVGGALAVFGDNNIKGAEAATKLISAVRIMAAPSPAAAKNLALIGLSTLSLANDMRRGGLVLALQDLQTHLKNSGDTASEQGLVIARAFGGKQSTGVQVLLHQLDRLRVKTEDARKGAHTLNEALNATKQQPAFKIDAGLATLKADLTRFGTDVLPPLLKIGGSVVKDVDHVAKAFMSLPKDAQHAIVTGGLVLAGIGPALKILGATTNLVDRGFKLAKLAGALTGFSRAASTVAGGGKSLNSTVARMEVATMIVKTQVGGSGSGKGVPGVPPTVAAGAEGAVSVEAAAAAASARMARITTGVTGASALGIKGFASMSHAQGTPLNKLNAFAHGIDPTSVLHLVGLPSLSDLLPTVKKRIQLSPQDIAALGMGFTNPASVRRVITGTRGWGAFGKSGHPVATSASVGGLAPASVSQATKDFLSMNAVLAQIESKTIGLGQAAAALGALSKQAGHLGDVRYQLADKLGAELLKAHGITRAGIRTLIDELGRLPPAAQGAAQDAMLELTTQLQRGGKVAKSTLDTVFAAIVGDAAAKFSSIPGVISSQIRKGKYIGAPSVVGHAQGGLVQIGSAGQKGIDSIPLSVSGAPIMVGAGEQVAVFTHQQQDAVNAALSAQGYDGLTGLFSNMTAKHSMATGGIVRGFNVGGLVGETDPLTGKWAKYSQAQWDAIWAKWRQNQSTTGAASATGSTTYWGKNPTTGQRVKHSKAEWTKIMATYARDHAAASKTVKGRAPVDPFAAIPSNSVGFQISATLLSNALQVAQNSGNTVAQNKALAGELTLDKSSLTADQKQLAKIKQALAAGGLSPSRRGALKADELAQLQAIGSIQGNIGTVGSSLTGGTGTSASTSQFDLTPGGGAVNLPTAFDVSRAIGGRRGLDAARRRSLKGGLHGAPVGAPHVVNVSQTLNISAAKRDAAEVKHIVDQATQKMTDDIERGMRALHATRRSAGLRGT
jgi:TP901 family phage tail tape measure protein